jgi:para-nitrobenzyl esterase
MTLARRLLAVAGAITAALTLSSAAASAAAPHTRVQQGALQGVRKGDVDAFLGVPFAAPPVGERRWKAPAPAAAWTGVRNADHFSASCWQGVSPAGFGPWTHEYVVDGKVSEDCLYLNVWTGAPAGAKRPVLVWIYGGGFNSGSGSVPIYDGAALAGQGVVVVTINYRVGVLGFFAHPELTAESRGAPPGNQGLQDMAAALRWVKANIAAFGGDPSRVTVAGQSAGAIAIHELMESPMARGLFQQAIIESGLPNIAPLAPLAKGEASGEALAKAKGVSSLAGLRALAPDRLGGAGPPGLGLIRDGVFMPAEPGPAADIPVLIGLNSDEGSSFSPLYGTTDPAKVSGLLKDSYGDQADRVAGLYPVSTDAERAQASRDILRDRGLASLYAWSGKRLTSAKSPLYAYLYTHPEPGPQADRYRAFHSSEIPYAFRTFAASPERNFTADDQRVSLQVSGYWLNFIRTGNPNGAGLPAWPRMSPGKPMIMQLGDGVGARPVLEPEKLQAVDAFLAKGGEPRIF